MVPVPVPQELHRVLEGAPVFGHQAPRGCIGRDRLQNPSLKGGGAATAKVTRAVCVFLQRVLYSLADYTLVLFGPPVSSGGRFASAGTHKGGVSY
jgi:hypothetical protein